MKGFSLRLDTKVSQFIPNALSVPNSLIQCFKDYERITRTSVQ